MPTPVNPEEDELSKMMQSGSAQSNQRLSERRAASVLEYLTSNGVPAGRLVAVGFGEAKPVVANTSVANKARNRRIEFVPIGS